MEQQTSKDTFRLIAFIVLSIGVLIGWEYLFPMPKPKPPAKRQLVKGNGKPSSVPAAQRAGLPTSWMAQRIAQNTSRPSSQPATQKVQPTVAKKTLEYGNDLFNLQLSNIGGAFSEFYLRKFYDPKVKEKENKKVPFALVAEKLAKTPPFSERLVDPGLVSHSMIQYGDAKKDKNGDLVFVGRVNAKRGGYIEVEKRYKFRAGSYQFVVMYKFTNHSNDAINSKMALQLYDQENPKNLSAGGMFSTPTTFQLVCQLDDDSKPKRFDVLKLKDQDKAESFNAKNTIHYVGIDRRYFMMALVPNWGRENSGSRCVMDADKKGAAKVVLFDKGVRLGRGESYRSVMKGFLGPKYFDRLSKVGGKLESSVDFGIFAVLCRPMLWLMQKFYNFFGRFGLANWGIAIILLTLLVKLAMLPLTHRSMKSMKGMQKLKPKMDKLKAKYGDDRESLNREMMKLYVEEGVNPAAGCLPMLLQMPIWIALYQTLFYAVELYQAPFIPGWINDLSTKDPVFVLPLLLGVSMYFQQKLTPQTMDEMQARIMGTVMPVFFTVIMLFLPAGLTLYIFVNTILSMLHHLYIHKMPDEPGDSSKKKKKPRKPGLMQRMQEMAEAEQKRRAQEKKKRS